MGTRNASRNLIANRPNRTDARPTARSGNNCGRQAGEGRRRRWRKRERWPRGFPARIAERFRDHRSQGRDRHDRRTGGERREISSCRSFTSREGDERSKNRMRAPGARALTRALRAGDPPPGADSPRLSNASLPSFLLLALPSLPLSPFPLHPFARRRANVPSLGIRPAIELGWPLIADATENFIFDSVVLNPRLRGTAITRKALREFFV